MSCDWPEFYSERFPVAKKKHRCCECRDMIEPGEKYLLVGGKWDGILETYKQHLLCREACMAISNIADDCIPFGSLMEDYREWCAYHRNKLELKTIRDLMAKILRRKHKNRLTSSEAGKILTS